MRPDISNSEAPERRPGLRAARITRRVIFRKGRLP